MDKCGKANPTSNLLRYSIPAILKIGHLCETNKAPFDLSRLSFAVFQAGIVKPSGAYAPNFTMPLQDVSVNCNHGSSLGTASSAEDYMIFSGSGRRLLEPRRQPINPPGSPGGRVQADEGFVRFFKANSSPNHRRVTAGGRVVPMEQPPTPPQFKLFADNSNHRSVAATARNVVDGQLWHENNLQTSDRGTQNMLSNAASRLLNPNANTHLSQKHRLLTEPFPKFHDCQTGQRDIQKAATENNKTFLYRNTGMERTVCQSAAQSLGTHQNTDQHMPQITASQATLTQLRQVHLPVHAPNSTRPNSANTQYPSKMQSSQQKTVNKSQYAPSTSAFALDEAPAAVTLDLGYNAHGIAQQPLTTGFGAYHTLDLGASQAVFYPNHFPTVSQGFQVSPAVGLPTFANQFSLAPPAYYAPDPFNTSASLSSALATRSLTDVSTTLAAPNALNTGATGAPNQLLLQHELVLAESAFQNSTEQERMLDQYLAMHMDKMELQTRQAWTSRRMQIVEERAAAKDRMNQVQQALNAETARTTHMQSDCQPITSPWSAVQNCPINQLNVQAPPWVPKAGAGSSRALRIQDPSAINTTTPIIPSQSVSPQQANLEESALTSLKPMVAVSKDPFTAKQSALLHSPGTSPVDEWGARLGTAPPELERQQSEQSELLEFIATEARQALASSRTSTGGVPEPDGSWETKDRQAAAQVEADPGQYLGAIRKNPGVTSLPKLSRGQVVKVEGQNYKQPKPSYIGTDFERDCWLRKPDLDQRHGIHHSRPFERSFENDMLPASPRKSKQTQEWVNGIVNVRKPVYSGRAPWISDGMNLLSTKGDPSISLQETYATSKTRGTNGAADHLRGRR